MYVHKFMSLKVLLMFLIQIFAETRDSLLLNQVVFKIGIPFKKNCILILYSALYKLQ